MKTSYTNLAHYLAAIPDRNSWSKPFQSGSGELIYRHKFQDDSMFKIYGAYRKRLPELSYSFKTQFFIKT